MVSQLYSISPLEHFGSEEIRARVLEDVVLGCRGSCLEQCISYALEFCANEAMHICGGAGHMRGNPVERIYREVKVFAIGGGSEEIMRYLSLRQMGL